MNVLAMFAATSRFGLLLLPPGPHSDDDDAAGEITFDVALSLIVPESTKGLVEVVTQVDMLVVVMEVLVVTAEVLSLLLLPSPISESRVLVSLEGEGVVLLSRRALIALELDADVSSSKLSVPSSKEFPCTSISCCCCCCWGC